jgi:predicted metal-dependent phosphoesterase TrpH
VKADLHCHSHFSDGKHSPEFLLQRAADNGISHLAITDHDCLDCHQQTLASAAGLTLIPGVEISCNWENREIHVVGLGVDASAGDLTRSLETQQAKRQARILAMHDMLVSLGINGLDQHMDSLPAVSWTRSHVAEFLVDNGHCKNWDKAFKRYLGRRGKIWVPIAWLELAEAIELIRQAGGIAVLAHPGRYSLSRRKLQQLAEAFRLAGGEGLEGSYGNIDPVMRRQLCELAMEQGLYISQGSDFHNADRHWTDLGKMPNLDTAAIKNAIWDHPRWHF